MIWSLAKTLLSANAADRGVVLRDNWGEVITGDIKGDVVIVNGDRHSFSLHIPKVDDVVPENIGSLLTWRSRIPKTLYGREAELAELLRWCHEPADIRVRILHGEGGAGKSRLAFELAENLRLEGWQAGQLVNPGQVSAFPLSQRGILLVIDYPEQFPAAVENLLRVIKNSELPGVRLRLLLLSRNRDVLKALVDRQVEWFHSPSIELRPIQSADASWALFQDAWRSMAKLKGASTLLPLNRRNFDTWVSRDPQHTQPLILLSFALNLTYDAAATELSRTEILERLVQRERDRLTSEVEHRGLQSQGVVLLKALAAIPGRLTATDIDSMAMSLSHPGIELPAAMQLQLTSLWRHGELAGLQPDLLAATLIDTVLRDWLDDPRSAGPWIWSALTAGASTDDIVRARLRRIVWLSSDRPGAGTHKSVPGPIVAALMSIVSHHDDKAETIDRLLNRNEALGWILLPLALSAAARVVKIWERRASGDDFATHAPGLASSLNTLSLCLAHSGDRSGGLAAVRRAVEICEQLARHDFAAHASDLALSLSNLSNHLSRLHDRSNGLTAIRRAVEIREQLAKDNSASRASDLASSLNNLATHLAESGDRRGSLAAVRRSVAIREQLVKDDSATYAAELAASLSNLSIRLAESGDRAGGLVAIRPAVDIYEQLAMDNFDAHGPDLSMILTNLSHRLAESGDRPGALAAIRRAVEIDERLIQASFVAYAFDLATSLHNLSFHLATCDDIQGALAANRRAVEILETLAKDDYPAYAPYLASSLLNLSRRLEESGDRSGGFATICRSVEIREQLANENFSAYAGDLASSLNNLSNDLAERGDHAGSLTTIRRTVAIYEQLANDNFVSHAPDLALSLNNLSICMAACGDHPGGLAASRRAVEIFEPLAKENAKVHASHLGLSLTNLSVRLIETGDHEQAFAAFSRALGLPRDWHGESKVTVVCMR